MANLKVMDQNGKDSGEVTLNDKVFGIEPNDNVVFEAIIRQRAGKRQGTSKVKNRSAVRGGGKKPWRQKGTGRARQGSTRAPQWVGGGTVFGPTPRSYAFKLNKKVKQLGLKNVLTYKVNENQLIAVENVTLADAKTKNFVKLLANIKAEGKTVVVVAPEEFNETQVLASRNVAGVFLTPANNASVYELLCYKNLVLTEAAVKYFEEVLK